MRKMDSPAEVARPAAAPSPDRPDHRHKGLTKAQVAEMRRLRRVEKWSLPRIARKFGVSRTTVYYYCSGPKKAVNRKSDPWMGPPIKSPYPPPWPSQSKEVKRAMDARQMGILTYLAAKGGAADARDLRRDLLATQQYSRSSLWMALRWLLSRGSLLRFSIGAKVVPVNRHVYVYAIADSASRRARYPLPVVRLLHRMLVEAHVPEDDVLRHLGRLRHGYDGQELVEAPAQA